MAKEILFIGGPADGQRREVDETLDIVFVVGARYNKKVMVSRDKTFVVFTYGEMRSFEVVEQLIEGYRRV